MINMLPFTKDSKYLKKKSKDANAKKVKSNESSNNKATVFNVEVIPEEMNIFMNSEEDFLPEGKSFKDLTSKELDLLKKKYRFSPYKPGIYQGITGWMPRGKH